MSDIVQFPGAEPQAEEHANVDRDKRWSQAFLELESDLRDCVRMAHIAAQLMFDANVEDDQLRFAVFHTAEMMVQLEKQYDASFNEESDAGEAP